MRVLIAASGLGHTNRGVENWAKQLATALAEQGGLEVLLAKGSNGESHNEWVLPCVRRDSLLLGGKDSPISWRCRLAVEETTFSFPLAILAKTKNIDIIHTAQPFPLLYFCKRKGLIESEIIFTNQDFLYPKLGGIYVQQTAPHHLMEAQNLCIDASKWFMIPNFVDTEEFNPNNRSPLRAELGIPENASVILSVGAITKRYKRMNWLIEETYRLKQTHKEKIFLLIVGELEDETKEVINMGRSLLGDSVRFLWNLPHEKMAEIYAISDLFVMCSAPEAFGIAFLEAMASGKPVIGHDYPVTKWIIGDGGDTVDMTKKGELARVMELYILDGKLREKKGRVARNRSEELFSRDKIINQILQMYHRVIS